MSKSDSLNDPQSSDAAQENMPETMDVVNVADVEPVEEVQQPAVAGQPTSEANEGAEETPFVPGRHIPIWIRDSLSWVTSLVAHVAILLGLGLWVFDPELPPETSELVSIPSPLDEPLDFEEIDLDPVETVDDSLESEIAEVPQPETENIEEETEFSLVDDVDAAAVKVELAEIADNSAQKSDLLLEVGAHQGGGLSGRGKAARSGMVKKGGGTKGSEAAVARALKWLATHQNPDGSWSFDHRGGVCQGRCGNEGRFSDARNGATAMALLPFLGAGQTHKDGQYQDTVYRGLYYLGSAMKVTSKGGSLTDPGGRMYSHGLAAIALSEAYAMTRDPELAQPAQLALNYIMYAQDPVGGGWRYSEQQAGDTSVLGWQIMALKSGSMAYLNVDTNVVKKSYRFLDSVQTDSGAAYGYTTPGKGAATSAVGLLCRMYMGWDQNNGSLETGVNRIAGRGPLLRAFNRRQADNMYYNYYATQVMFQYTGAKGKQWDKWNTAMRDTLIKTQATKGHETGSWFMEGGHARTGGRLYCTSLATLILEVYYRHMPIFRASATEEDFPE